MKTLFSEVNPHILPPVVSAGQKIYSEDVMSHPSNNTALDSSTRKSVEKDPQSISAVQDSASNVTESPHLTNQSLSNKMNGSTTVAPSTNLYNASAVLGPWSAVVSQWKLEPAEVEAEKKENSIQHSGAIIALTLGRIFNFW